MGSQQPAQDVQSATTRVCPSRRLYKDSICIGLLPRRAEASLCPLRDADSRALSHNRSDIEFVHQPPGATQAQAQAFPGGIPILHCQIDVADTRPVIPKGQAQPLAATVVEKLQPYRSAGAPIQGVASQFTGRSDDLRLIHLAEALLHGPGTRSLPNSDDVRVGADRQDLMPVHGHAHPLLPVSPLRNAGAAFRCPR
jgi:hypothetical protein